MTLYKGNHSSFHRHDISDLNWSVTQVTHNADSQEVVLNATATPGANHSLFGDDSYLSFRVSCNVTADILDIFVAAPSENFCSLCPSTPIVLSIPPFQRGE